jgi:opacity protein-like surface antigen
MPSKSIQKHTLAAIISIAALSIVVPAQAAETDSAVGFYGGVSLRDRGSESIGLQPVMAPASWARFASASVDESAGRAVVFGGYRWRNEVAVEASFSSVDKYSLRPGDTAPTARGLGLASSAGGLTDTATRGWNVDVTTSWAFYKAFSLYGRMGYATADALPATVNPNLANVADPRRLRDGVNVGLGLRYDVRSDLGLRLEYGRFARFGAETGTLLPEADQVSVGVQYRF